MNEFNKRYLNPLINYHRPCFFPEKIANKKGRVKIKYPYKNMMTPYEKLKSLPQADQYLKPGFTFKWLDEIERKMTDNEAADKLNKARRTLFKQIRNQSKQCING